MAKFQQMVSLARSPSEAKKDYPAPASDGDFSAPVYPYGTCISLSEEELAKLKIGDLPEVGATIHLSCMAKVTSVSESESENAKGEKMKRCRVELQITDMACENEDEENESYSSEERAEGRYGKRGAA